MGKRTVLSLLLALSLLLPGCAGAPAAGEGGRLSVVATTYPVYLFTTAVTEGVEGVEVTLMVNQQTSCLHDYTLTVNDMKAIEGADVIVMNGAGLEDFMSDALASSEAAVIDCSQGVELLPALGHDGHDHDTEYDPHIWMDPNRAAQMVRTIREELSELDPDHAQQYQENTSAALELLEMGEEGAAAMYLCAAATAHSSLHSVTNHTELITFHDGFQYFAQAFELELLESIEEEEGSEASAAEVKEIVALVEEYQLPAIYTEVNGSDATAQVIARETGCAVYPLDMIMSGDGEGIRPYFDAMKKNLQVIAYGAEALG